MIGFRPPLRMKVGAVVNMQSIYHPYYADLGDLMEETADGRVISREFIP